jgi:hypothetical protein
LNGAVFEDGNTAVGCAEIDSYYFAHSGFLGV